MCDNYVKSQQGECRFIQKPKYINVIWEISWNKKLQLSEHPGGSVVDYSYHFSEGHCHIGLISGQILSIEWLMCKICQYPY